MLTTPSPAQGFDDGLSDPVEDDVIVSHEKKVARPGRVADTAPASPRIKQEPSACEIRQQTLRIRRQERAIQQSRADDSSVTSVDAVSIGRWPPKYVSPPPPSPTQGKRSARLAKKGKGSTSAYASLLDSSSDDESSQPLMKRFRKNQPVEGNANRRIPHRNQSKASAQQNSSHQSSANKKLPASPNGSQRLTDPEQLVTFYFFAGEENFGALPASMKQCKTAKSFFDKSALALSLSSGRSNEHSVRAVTVAIDGFDWPLVIPWRDADGFRIMLQQVGDHVSQGRESLNIKVTCIAKK